MKKQSPLASAPNSRCGITGLDEMADRELGTTRVTLGCSSAKPKAMIGATTQTFATSGGAPLDSPDNG